MHTNAYIYSEWRKECILIDPGADSALILKRLNLINMRPRGILLTHGHIDHISAAMSVREHYREPETEIPIAIHEDDSRFLGHDALEAHVELFGGNNGSGFDRLDAQIGQLPEADMLLTDGDTVFGADLSVIHTPGHTPGSICVYSESQGLVFSGDTLLFEDIGRTDLPGGDRESMLASIRDRVFVLPDTTRVCPGHGPFTTLEREIRHNPYFE